MANTEELRKARFIPFATIYNNLSYPRPSTTRGMIGQPCQCYIHFPSLHQTLLSNRDYRPRVHLGLMHAIKSTYLYEMRIPCHQHISWTSADRAVSFSFITHCPSSIVEIIRIDVRLHVRVAHSAPIYFSFVLFNCTSWAVTFGGLVRPVNTSLVQAIYAASSRSVQQYQSSLTNSGHKSNSPEDQ